MMPHALRQPPLLPAIWSQGLGESGGEGGIRTHGTRWGTTVFETVPIDHSGTSPRRAPDDGYTAIRVEGRPIAEGAGPAKSGVAAF